MVCTLILVGCVISVTYAVAKILPDYGQWLYAKHVETLDLGPVDCPSYLAIDIGYEPPIYSYTYLLSPASSWADFGEFELNIETPYFITASSLELAKTQNGYAFSQKGLPAGELTFTASTSEHPEARGMDLGGLLAGSLLSVVLIYVAVAGSIIAVIFLAVYFAMKKKH